MDAKVEGKATVENLVELENKMYRELDKVVLNIMKQVTGDDSKKGFKLLQSQVKRLYEFYTTSAQLLKDSTEEAAFVRRSNGGFSCASCDKDVSNLYNTLNQSHAKERGAKGAGFSKLLMAQAESPTLKPSNSQKRVISYNGKGEKAEEAVSEPQLLPEIVSDKKK